MFMVRHFIHLWGISQFTIEDTLRENNQDVSLFFDATLKVRYESDILLWGLIMTKPSNLYLEAGLAVEELATTSVCDFFNVWRYPIYYALGLDQCKKFFCTWLYPVVESQCCVYFTWEYCQKFCRRINGIAFRICLIRWAAYTVYYLGGRMLLLTTYLVGAITSFHK